MTDDIKLQMGTVSEWVSEWERERLGRISDFPQNFRHSMNAKQERK